MRVTLIHNEGAGTGAAESAEIERLIRAAGYDLTRALRHEDDWESALSESVDLVVASGGDGTVSRVAKRMIGRGIPVAVLPGGTANNIAMSIGVGSKSREELIKGWGNGHRYPVDVLRAHGPWGDEVLIEGLGCGLLAWTMHKAPREKMQAIEPKHRLAEAVHMLRDQVNAFPASHVRGSLDGVELSGDYIMFEVMNTQFAGPSLHVVPDGNLGDGMLDVVSVADSERGKFHDHLARDRRGPIAHPRLETRRGKMVELVWTGFEVHLDDRLWPREGETAHPDAPIEVRVERHAVEFLVP